MFLSQLRVKKGEEVKEILKFKNDSLVVLITPDTYY
jgi:hypothetical protein